MTANRPAPTDAQVEALGSEMADGELRFGMTWEDLTPWQREHYRRLAREALSSSVIDDLIAEASAQALREAGVAFDTEALSLKPGGWGSNPADQQTAQFAVEVMHWLRRRAAALSPTPADGTTSERSEA